GPGGEHAAVVPVAVVGQIRVVQQAPELDLRDAGTKRRLDLGDAVLGDFDGPFDAHDLVRRFDDARFFRHGDTVDDLQATLQEGLRQARVDVFHCDAPIVGADLQEIVADVLGDQSGVLGKLRAAVEICVLPADADVI